MRASVRVVGRRQSPLRIGSQTTKTRTFGLAIS
jgi:hypothetical protein